MHLVSYHTNSLVRIDVSCPPFTVPGSCFTATKLSPPTLIISVSSAAPPLLRVSLRVSLTLLPAALRSLCTVEKNLPGASLLNNGFKIGTQAHITPVPTSTTDQFNVGTAPIVTSVLCTLCNTVIRMIEATAANSPNAKRPETMYFSRFGNFSFQKKGSGRMHSIRSVTIENAVVK